MDIRIGHRAVVGVGVAAPRGTAAPRGNRFGARSLKKVVRFRPR
ncbi:hypothetical protein [Chamaesiphon minutus]|nr:hypothetical protein [Chamaesiphon minutus]